MLNLITHCNNVKVMLDECFKKYPELVNVTDDNTPVSFKIDSTFTFKNKNETLCNMLVKNEDYDKLKTLKGLNILNCVAFGQPLLKTMSVKNKKVYDKVYNVKSYVQLDINGKKILGTNNPPKLFCTFGVTE